MHIEEKDGSLVIVDFNELGAYKIACKIEKDGIDFYKKLSGKITQDKPKEILTFLLNEEKKHIKLFEELLFKMRQKKEDGFEEDDLLGTIDYGIFQPYQDSKELENILDNPKKALKLGLIIEDKSIKFYESCRDHVSVEETKKEISNIIQEERRHKQLLEDIQNKL